MNAPQSPAPVAGAVEALVAELKWLVNEVIDDFYVGTLREHQVLEAIDRLAALHPQPAPAVAVETERELFEAKFPRPAGVEWIGDGYEVKDSYENSYACDRYIARWTTWLAARSAPAVAEKVPLTNDQVWADDGIMSLNAEIGFPMPFLMRTVRAVERAHGIGSGSAQEGQANG